MCSLALVCLSKGANLQVPHPDPLRAKDACLSVDSSTSTGRNKRSWVGHSGSPLSLTVSFRYLLSGLSFFLDHLNMSRHMMQTA